MDSEALAAISFVMTAFVAGGVALIALGILLMRDKVLNRSELDNKVALFVLTVGITAVVLSASVLVFISRILGI